MEIRISTAARNRAFSKAIRRIRAEIDVTLGAISSIQLVDPTWSTVLLTLTDDVKAGTINETSTDDGVIQLLAGFPLFNDWSPGNDHHVRTAVIAILGSVIEYCGLTPSDSERLRACLQ